MEKECINLTCKRDSDKVDEKLVKMFNQVKRIIELPDTIFNSLADDINENMGKEVKEVLQQLYEENSTN